MRLLQAAAGFWDITAQLVDYGRSVLSDVPTVQLAAAEWHAANPVQREAGPRGGGRARGIMEDQ